MLDIIDPGHTYEFFRVSVVELANYSLSITDTVVQSHSPEDVPSSNSASDISHISVRQCGENAEKMTLWGRTRRGVSTVVEIKEPPQ